MTQTVRTTAPEPLSPVPFDIPQPIIRTFSNGIKLVIFEDRRLPLVSFRLAVLSGDANDPADSNGLSSAMASMLTEGTLNYTSRELAEKIERVGASVSANASSDFTVISASSLSLYTNDVLDLIAEVALRPTFPQAELDLYKQNSIENLKFQRSQPNFLANEQAARILYGDHPYAKISPSAADFEKLNRKDLIDFHARTIQPNNAVFIVVGDVDGDEIAQRINERFGHLQTGEKDYLTFTVPPIRTERTITIVDRPGSAQSNIILANLAIERDNPDYFAVLVMNQVLGAGASSRVFMNLREEKGYTYGAYTRIDAKRVAGEFEATAEVRTAVTGDSIKEFFYELNRIRDDKVSDAELADAQNFLTGVFPIRAETQEGLTNLIVSQQLYGLPADYLQTYREEVSRITIDDVQRVARKYIDPEKIAMIVVGDAGDVLPQIGQYSDRIEIFDTDGNSKELAEYEEPARSADVSGEWQLELNFQGQKVPVTLKIEQANGGISGSLETMLGNGKITGGNVRGNKLTAVAAVELQGQEIEFRITAETDEDKISGSIESAAVPQPLNFTGLKKKD